MRFILITCKENVVLVLHIKKLLNQFYISEELECPNELGFLSFPNILSGVCSLYHFDTIDHSITITIITNVATTFTQLTQISQANCIMFVVSLSLSWLNSILLIFTQIIHLSSFSRRAVLFSSCHSLRSLGEISLLCLILSQDNLPQA